MPSNFSVLAAALLAGATLSTPSFAESVRITLSVEQGGSVVQAMSPVVRIGDSAAACAGETLPGMPEGVLESQSDVSAADCDGWRLSASVSRGPLGTLTVGWVAALRDQEVGAMNFAGATAIVPGAPAQVVESADGYVVRVKADAARKAGR